MNNVKWEPLIDPRKVLVPPLHIKLGLIKQFVTALDKESAAFKYLQDLFPQLSEAISVGKMKLLYAVVIKSKFSANKSVFIYRGPVFFETRYIYMYMYIYIYIYTHTLDCN